MSGYGVHVRINPTLQQKHIAKLIGENGDPVNWDWVAIERLVKLWADRGQIEMEDEAARIVRGKPPANT